MSHFVSFPTSCEESSFFFFFAMLALLDSSLFLPPSLVVFFESYSTFSLSFSVPSAGVDSKIFSFPFLPLLLLGIHIWDFYLPPFFNFSHLLFFPVFPD